MRIIKILLCLLLMVHMAFATDYDLARKLSALTGSQKALLYQYGTLAKFATANQADSFWEAHHSAIPDINMQDAKVLANELLTNTELVYKVKKPSRLQSLRGLFTTARLLLALAGLLIAFALIQLTVSYWNAIRLNFIKYLGPVFRKLFSPVLLTWELLLLGAAGICFGPQISEVVIRTVVIHLALFLIWSQLTALFTGKTTIKDYLSLMKKSFGETGAFKNAFIWVFLPALIITLLVVRIIMVCDDTWYLYEVAAPAMMAICAFPLMRKFEQPISRIIFPFGNRLKWDDRELASFVAVAIAVWMVLLYAPAFCVPSLLVLSIGISLALFLMGIIAQDKAGVANYLYLQVVSLLFLVGEVLAGTHRGIPLLTWTGLSSLFLYILIKYWEVPLFFGWSWKNKKAWGTLGMALIIWGIATLIRLLPEWFIHIFQ